MAENDTDTVEIPPSLFKRFTDMLPYAAQSERYFFFFALIARQPISRRS
jgi:hypothetical protein